MNPALGLAKCSQPVFLRKQPILLFLLLFHCCHRRGTENKKTRLPHLVVAGKEVDIRHAKGGSLGQNSATAISIRVPLRKESGVVPLCTA